MVGPVVAASLPPTTINFDTHPHRGTDQERKTEPLLPTERTVLIGYLRTKPQKPLLGLKVPPLGVLWPPHPIPAVDSSISFGLDK